MRVTQRKTFRSRALPRGAILGAVSTTRTPPVPNPVSFRALLDDETGEEIQLALTPEEARKLRDSLTHALSFLEQGGGLPPDSRCNCNSSGHGVNHLVDCPVALAALARQEPG